MKRLTIWAQTLFMVGAPFALVACTDKGNSKPSTVSPKTSSKVTPSTLDTILDKLSIDLKSAGFSDTVANHILKSARDNVKPVKLNIRLQLADDALTEGTQAIVTGAISSLSSSSLELTADKTKAIQTIVGSLSDSIVTLTASADSATLKTALEEVTKKAVDSIPASGLTEADYEAAIGTIVASAIAKAAPRVPKDVQESTLKAISTGAVRGMSSTTRDSKQVALQLEAIARSGTAALLILEKEGSVETSSLSALVTGFSQSATEQLVNLALSETGVVEASAAFARGATRSITSGKESLIVNMSQAVSSGIISGQAKLTENGTVLAAAASAVTTESIQALKDGGVASSVVTESSTAISRQAVEGLRSLGVSETAITQAMGASALQSSSSVETPTDSSIITSTAATAAPSSSVATVVPTATPTAAPTAEPTTAPTAEPTAAPTAAPTATPAPWIVGQPSVSPSSLLTGQTLTCTANFACTNSNNETVGSVAFDFYRTRSGTSTLRGTQNVTSTSFTSVNGQCATSATYTLANATASGGNTSEMDKAGDSMTCVARLTAGTSTLTTSSSSSATVGASTPVLSVSSGSATQSSLTAGSAIANITLSASSADGETPTISEVTDSCNILSLSNANVISGTMPSFDSPAVDIQCTATYTATAAGQTSNTVSVQLTAPVPQVANLSTQVSAAPTTVIGSSGTITVTLSNTGNGSASNVSASAVSAPWQLSSSTCNSTLAASSSCTLQYTFTPTERTTSSSTVTISYDSTTVTAQLEGTGIECVTGTQQCSTNWSQICTANRWVSRQPVNVGTLSERSLAGGRYLVFVTTSALVEADNNGVGDVYLKDLETGAVSLITKTPTGTAADKVSYTPSVTSDGNKIVYASDATNLVSGDTNARRDIFLYDRQADSTTRLSVDANGAQTTGTSSSPVISLDGKYVAYVSNGVMVAAKTSTAVDVFLRDTTAGTNTLVSTGAGSGGNGASSALSMSGDGKFIAYISAATNLTSGDTNGAADVFVWSREANTTTRVVGSDGSQGNGAAASPSISNDGRYVVFESTANNLVTGDSNAVKDVFLWDSQAGKVTALLSKNADGSQGNGASSGATISRDGARVAFASAATNLVSGDDNALTDIFELPLSSPTSIRVVSATQGGVVGLAASDKVTWDSTNWKMVFNSSASNLLPDADGCK